MDGSFLAILAAGTGVIGVMAYSMWPRREDYFELAMAELAEQTTASGSGRALPGDSELDGRAMQPAPPKGAPVPSIQSSLGHVGHSDPATGPAADVQPIPPGGRASFLRLVE